MMDLLEIEYLIRTIFAITIVWQAEAILLTGEKNSHPHGYEA
jgi:hypothetical protein